MRRIATTAILALAASALLVFGVGADEEQGYVVRAAFDNGSFLVPGEVVRVAGADVGEITATEISTDDEIVSLDPEPHAEPGKAIVEMTINDPAFQDFREDASCIIRPQSLLGERFVDCEPTQPRAPGSEPPPELGEIPEGEEGAGQRLLPLEANGKAVDLDLVNNIMRRPYAERFTIILNELGAGLAARGDELGEVIDRGNPALRETDRILNVLASQSQTLSKLTRDSDIVLAPLARQRQNVAGFINNSGDTAEASAERRADIEAQLELLPPSLRELRSLMIELRRFSDEARPVFADLGSAAPSIAGATRALGPLADATEPALISLGDVGEVIGPDLQDSNPVIQDLGKLASRSTQPARDLKDLLKSLRESGGYEFLNSMIPNFSGALNGMDQYGHFLRTQFLASNCTDYVTAPLTGCSANFIQTSGTRASTPSADTFGVEDMPSASELRKQARKELATPQKESGGAPPLAKPPSVGFEDLFGVDGRLEGGSRPASQSAGDAEESLRGADELMRFLMEDGA